MDGSSASAGVFAGQLNGLAVDSAGKLWVYDASEMYAFEAGDGFVADCQLNEGSASGIAAGPELGELYVAERNAVERRLHVCEAGETRSVVEEHTVAPAGLAGDASSGEVFGDLGSLVADLAPGVVEPVLFGPVAAGAGVGVQPGEGNPGEGKVYVASTGEEKVDVFDVSLEAQTDAAT